VRAVSTGRDLKGNAGEALRELAEPETAGRGFELKGLFIVAGRLPAQAA
jgi:hypothetical protein